MALTDTTLKGLKPLAASYIVSDDRGLYAEVLPSGSIVWRYRYRLSGRREKLTLGKYPALTLRHARLKRDEAAQAVALGHSPAQKKQLAKVAGPENATVAQFAERFFRDIQERDRKDNTMTRRYLDKDIVQDRRGGRGSRHVTRAWALRQPTIPTALQPLFGAATGRNVLALHGKSVKMRLEPTAWDAVDANGRRWRGPARIAAIVAGE
ncbi:MAG: Arm DNA-binding domain-containing protein [Steroidobacteraceae bacterium]